MYGSALRMMQHRWKNRWSNTSYKVPQKPFAYATPPPTPSVSGEKVRADAGGLPEKLTSSPLIRTLIKPLVAR